MYSKNDEFYEAKNDFESFEKVLTDRQIDQ